MRRSVDLERRLQGKTSPRHPRLELETPTCPLLTPTFHQFPIQTLCTRDPGEHQPPQTQCGTMQGFFTSGPWILLFSLPNAQFFPVNIHAAKSGSKTTSPRKSSNLTPIPSSRKVLLPQDPTEMDPSTHQSVWPGNWIFGASIVPTWGLGGIS